MEKSPGECRMKCVNCGSQLEPNWTHCPHCGKFKSVLKEPVTDAAVDSIFGKMLSNSPAEQPANERSGAANNYGSGVRGQVFEVIVRQALGGAPWRQICEGPMVVNNIKAEEIEAEVRRRRNLINPGSFKKAKEDKARKDKDAKQAGDTKYSEGNEVDADGTQTQSHDADEKTWGPPPTPPRPQPFSQPETFTSATLRLEKLYRDLDEFLQNAVKDKAQKEYSDKMVAELKEIINSVMRMETLMHSVQAEVSVTVDLERELKRTTKPITTEPPSGPHRIDW